MHFKNKQKWPPYKLHMPQHMSNEESDRRMEFCEWVLSKLNEDANISTKILFTDEANFPTMERSIGKTYDIGVMLTLTVSSMFSIKCVCNHATAS